MLDRCHRTALGILLGAATTLSATAVLGAMPSVKRIGFEDLRRISATTEESEPASSDNGAIELAGFMLPSDMEGELVYEFMLVSAPGACSHVAPPPANQVVRVIPDEPFAADHIYQLVRVSGQLENEHNLAQLHILDGVRTVESGFRISSADVTEIKAGPPTAPRTGKSPWKFMKD